MEAALKGLNSSARGETPGSDDEKNKKNLKGFNPFRVGVGVEFAKNPRVSPLAVEFLPFREKKRKSTNLSDPPDKHRHA